MISTALTTVKDARHAREDTAANARDSIEFSDDFDEDEIEAH